jgi:hypothetical protein
VVSSIFIPFFQFPPYDFVLHALVAGFNDRGVGCFIQVNILNVSLNLHIFLSISDGPDHLKNLHQVPAHDDSHNYNVISLDEYSVLLLISNFIFSSAHKNESNGEDNDDNKIDNIPLMFKQPALGYPPDEEPT